MDKLTLSVAEAAALSGIGRDKLYILAKSEGFPALKLGHSIRIPRKGLEAWLEREAVKEKAASQ